jgi:hypothetical protein
LASQDGCNVCYPTNDAEGIYCIAPGQRLKNTERFETRVADKLLHLKSGVSEAPKKFVYLLRSVHQPGRPYVGLTSNVPARVNAHNAGQNLSTAR